VLDDPGVTYLNAASIALTPLPVQDAARAFEDEIAGRGTIRFDDAAEARVYEGARENAARLLGCHPADVAVTTSATEALGQVAWWLRPGEGTNVVCIDVDFPSAVYPWYRVAEETGAEVRLVRAIDDPASLSTAAVEALIDERTAAVCVGHVQYATGHLLDPARLAAAAHAVGALLVLDATQSAGMVPIDVRAMGVDVLVAGSYKWLCGPFGAAVCALDPNVAERFRPPLVGWRSTLDQAAFDATRMPIAAGARGMEYSTVAYAAGVALGTAIGYVLDLRVEAVWEHDVALADRLAEGLTALGATFMSPIEGPERSAIVSVRFPGRDGTELWERLARAGVYTSPRLGAVRFAPHLYNHEADVDRALAELDRILS
jgi:cysteine desulfurase/selenocysteine lyase